MNIQKTHQENSMRKLVGIVILTASLTGCASVKDQNGNKIGSCIGLSCAVRGLFDYNHIDPETGLLEGTIAIGKNPVEAARERAAKAVSAPVEVKVLGEAATQQTPPQ